MSEEANKIVVQRLVEEVLNAGDLDRANEVIGADFIDHNPATPDQPPGPEGFRQVNSMLRAAFPDLSLTIEDLVAEGDRVVVRFTARGTQWGEFGGASPSGNRVAWEVISIIRVADGKIVERWSQSDTLSLMQQLQMDVRQSVEERSR